MATSFHQGSSEIQAPADQGSLHTLYLMNPNYVPISFSDTSTHHLVGIPLPTAVRSNNNSDDHSRPISFDQTDPSPHASFTPPRLHYNLWGPLDQTPAVSPTSTSAHQHLSLSLSSHHQHQGYNSNYMSSPPQTSGDDLRVFPRNSWSVSVSALSNGFSGVQSVLLGSKYLTAVQEILDEVVNVGKGTNAANLDSGIKDKLKIIRESTASIGASTSSGGDESNAKQGAELTTAQRQEFQVKRSKLVRMLDEVEHKYRQYHHQMQFVINSFEQAACFGSAKAYTDLALQTISKQFRSLKDTISRHIKATSKNLGEGECLGAKIEGSRLRYEDHHIRQQRSLQQLGMVQQNAWRPQRGLPGQAVSVLRAWLFEHFLHPYPKDSDKVMLAKQAGLTRSQVSNWFINARVRLWKPMVEEMYLEETKEQEKNVSKNKRKESTSITPQKSASIRSLDDEQMNNFWPRPGKFSNQHPSTNDMPSSSLLRSPIGGSLQSHSSCNLVGMSSMPESPKKPKSSEIENSPTSLSVDNTEMKASETSRGIATNYGSGFGTYPIADIERLNINSEQLALGFHGHGTSLTLGLPYCESFSLPNHGQISFHDHLGRRLEMGIAGEADFLGNQPSTTFS